MDNNTDKEVTQDVQGIFTIADIDKFNISRIESVKTNLLLNIDSMRLSDLQSQYMDLSSAMLTVLEKYFSQDAIKAKKTTIDGIEYSFYDLKEATKMNLNRTLIRIVAENSIYIYNSFMIQIGVAIPTSKTSKKKDSSNPFTRLSPTKTTDSTNPLNKDSKNTSDTTSVISPTF